MVFDDLAEAIGIEDKDALEPGIRRAEGRTPVRGRMGLRTVRVAVDRDAKAFAAQQQPQHPQFPVLEPVNLRMRLIVEVHQRARRNQVLTPAFAGRKKERRVRDLLGDTVNRPIHPRDLFVGRYQRHRPSARRIVPEPRRFTGLPSPMNAPSRLERHPHRETSGPDARYRPSLHHSSI